MSNCVTNHVIHGLDTNFVFGNNFVAPNPANHPLTSEDLALFKEMSGYWTRFAATGNPNDEREGNVFLPAFGRLGPGLRSNSYLILDSVIREGAGLRERQCDFLKPFFFRSIVGATPASNP